MATRISAYAEDSSTELTDERRLPLIGRSPKNSQKDITLCARATRDGGKKGTKLRRRSPKKQTETKLSLRTRAPPLHSTHPSPACIYFWAASFSPEGDLSCPYASSLAGCSISARRVAGNNWQSGGVATLYFRNYFEDGSWEQSSYRAVTEKIMIPTKIDNLHGFQKFYCVSDHLISIQIKLINLSGFYAIFILILLCYK